MEGDLTEHHPGVSEVEPAADGRGHSSLQRHGDVPSAWVPVVQNRVKLHRFLLPLRDEAGLKHTRDGREDLNATRKHVVAVHLSGGQIGKKKEEKYSESFRNQTFSTMNQFFISLPSWR